MESSSKQRGVIQNAGGRTTTTARKTVAPSRDNASFTRTSGPSSDTPAEASKAGVISVKRPSALPRKGKLAGRARAGQAEAAAATVAAPSSADTTARTTADGVEDERKALRRKQIMALATRSERPAAPAPRAPAAAVARPRATKPATPKLAAPKPTASVPVASAPVASVPVEAPPVETLPAPISVAAVVASDHLPAPAAEPSPEIVALMAEPSVASAVTAPELADLPELVMPASDPGPVLLDTPVAPVEAIEAIEIVATVPPVEVEVVDIVETVAPIETIDILETLPIAPPESPAPVAQQLPIVEVALPIPQVSTELCNVLPPPAPPPPAAPPASPGGTLVTTVVRMVAKLLRWTQRRR